MLRGKRLTKSQLNDNEVYPVLHGGSTPMGYYNTYNRKANTTVVVNTGNAGSVFFYDKEFWSSDACFSLYPNEKLLDKFLYLYVYGCERILKGKIRAGAMPTIDANAVKSLLIPIPSLEEQNRIVGILDTFTASIDNLKKQITQRRKQYEFYRDQLLDLEGKEGVEMKTSDFCHLKAGKSIKAEELNPYSKYPCYGGNGVRGYIDFFSHDGCYPIIGRQGALCGCVNWATGKFYATEHAVVATSKNIVNQRFLFYLFQNANLNQYKTQGAQPGLSVAKLNEISFKIPSLSEQERIVKILDTFEASITNLETQLAMRQKQYEYYRNKLLTFPAPLATAQS